MKGEGIDVIARAALRPGPTHGNATWGVCTCDVWATIVGSGGASNPFRRERDQN